MLAFLSRWLRLPPASSASAAAASTSARAPMEGRPVLLAEDMASLRRRFLAIALGRPESFPAAQTEVFLADLRAASEGDAFDALRLPRLPVVVPQLLQALREDKAGLAAIADLAARDPLVAGGIVRMANSAYYGAGEPLHSLSQAVVRLGRDAVRQVVLRQALRPIHPAAPGTPVHLAGERLWTHAQCCGVACGALGHGFDGMLAGLAGATGASAALGLLVRGGSELLHADAVHAAFPAAMWRIAARAAQAWELPAPVAAALREHAVGEARSELARGLARAEHFAMHYALHRGDEAPPAPALHDAAEAVAWAALLRQQPDD